MIPVLAALAQVPEDAYALHPVALPTAAVLGLMALSLLAIPFGLPGLWIMVVGVAALAMLGHTAWTSLLLAFLAVAAVEVMELLILRRFGAAYGGSRRAFWGAVAGGFLGLFAGLPVPLVGPVLTAFLGTFVGALAVTWLETRSLPASTRVGWGMLLARATSVGLKLGAGMALLVWAVLMVAVR